jgi:hypothetical protein
MFFAFAEATPQLKFLSKRAGGAIKGIPVVLRGKLMYSEGST